MTKLLTVYQVAQRWGKSPYTIRRWTRNGSLSFEAREHPGEKAAYYYSVEEVRRFERDNQMIVHDETVGQF